VRDGLDVVAHALELLQAAVHVLDVLEERVPPALVGHGRDELLGQMVELICDRVSEKREFLRGGKMRLCVRARLH
jgi:hypothetical protein